MRNGTQPGLPYCFPHELLALALLLLCLWSTLYFKQNHSAPALDPPSQRMHQRNGTDLPDCFPHELLVLALLLLCGLLAVLLQLLV
jgi:hypothetical protein